MSEREWARMDRHRTEFYVTLRALREHLPPPPARVLDCGGGPGRYAVELARWGYDVTLFDLSTGNLALAREKAAEAGVTLAGFEQGTALDLSRFADHSFDAVLLMGPLYHLFEEAERRRALAEARRVLKPGGPLFAAFISRYAAHRDAAVRFPTEPVDRPGLYERIEADGVLPPASSGPPTFTAYFARPDEVAPLCWEAGLEVATVLGVEGLVSVIEDQAVNGLTGPAWDWWAEANWRAAPDPSLHGAVEHLLVVARNPRWRPVLREIVRRLDEANVRYTVVGGTSLALHGLPLPVKDLDIETDPAGAYRFAELFAAHIVEPVALKESRSYRSHFGRFDFDWRAGRGHGPAGTARGGRLGPDRGHQHGIRRPGGDAGARLLAGGRNVGLHPPRAARPGGVMSAALRPRAAVGVAARRRSNKRLVTAY